MGAVIQLTVNDDDDDDGGFLMNAQHVRNIPDLNQDKEEVFQTVFAVEGELAQRTAVRIVLREHGNFVVCRDTRKKVVLLGKLERN